MTIPALPSLDRTSTTFRADLDSFFLTQLPATVTALNSEITRIDGIVPEGYVGNSTTSLTVASSGSVSLTVQAGKAFAAGQYVVLAVTADASTRMSGIVTTYNATSGALTLLRQESTGTGTYDAWTVALSAPAASPYYVGDIVLTARTLTAPWWLPADGAVYAQTSYYELFSALGLLRDGVVQPWVTGAVLAAGTYNPVACAPLLHNGTLYAYSWASSTTTHKLNRTTDGATVVGTASLPNTAAASAYLGVAAIGTTVVALPPSGNAWVALSTDSGATFISQPVTGYAGGYLHVIGSLFVILTGTTDYWTSPDGAVWTARTLPAAIYSPTSANGIAIGATGASTNTIYTTADGITWTARTMPATAAWRYSGFWYNAATGVWLAYADYNWARSTDNGATWSAVTLFAGATVAPATNSPEYTVRVFNGRFRVYSQLSSGDALLSSADGVTWSADQLPALDTITSYTIYNAMWVLGSELYLGNDASVWQSSNGTQWHRLSTVASQQQVAYWAYTYELGNNQIAVYAADTTLRRRPIYTYDSTTQFAVPRVPAGVDAYIKA